MDRSEVESENLEQHAVVRPGRDDPVEYVRAWIAWFGWGRIAVVVISVGLVAGGAWFLLRAPAAPVEQHLPMASAPTSAPSVGPPATSPVSPLGSASTSAVVHVAGAVGSPGVYSLRGDARLLDAIEAAGGPSAVADLDRLNLAQPITDGQRIYVPEIGVEPPPAVVPSDSGEPGQVATGPIDLNRADAALLERLPGVGPATAAAIVDDRTSNGPFASVDELDRVPGIGPAKLAALRDLVTV